MALTLTLTCVGALGGLGGCGQSPQARIPHQATQALADLPEPAPRDPAPTPSVTKSLTAAAQPKAASQPNQATQSSVLASSAQDVAESPSLLGQLGSGPAGRDSKTSQTTGRANPFAQTGPAEIQIPFTTITRLKPNPSLVARLGRGDAMPPVPFPVVLGGGGSQPPLFRTTSALAGPSAVPTVAPATLPVSARGGSSVSPQALPTLPALASSDFPAPNPLPDAVAAGMAGRGIAADTSLAIAPEPPTPISRTALADAAQVQGFVEVGDRVSLLVKDPEAAVTLTLQIGDSFAGGKVRFRRIENAKGKPSQAIFEQNGIEVRHNLGV